MTFERAAQLLGYETVPAWVTGIEREAFIACAVKLSANDSHPIDPKHAAGVRVEVDMFA